MNRCVAALLIAMALVAPALAQSLASSNEEGLPLFDCTSAKETGGSNQIWSIIQDNRGIIYIGSNGATEFDGASWRLIANNGFTAVRSLDHDENGRVYMAGGREFGYLAPDSIGRRRYHSLLPFIPEEHRTFEDVWRVNATPKGVYFLAREKLFLATPMGDGWTIRAWTPEQRFLYGFWHNDTYYIHQQGAGFSRMDGDRIVSIPGGEQFGSERLQVLLPDPDVADAYILGTFNRGLFRYDGDSFTPWMTEADAYLKANTLYKGAALLDGSFALTTLAGGIVLLRSDGSLRGIINADSGLPGNDVLSVFADQSGLLWMAPQGWLCQIDVFSPLTRFDASLGLDGDLTDIHRHDGVLYITTQNAVQYLDASAGRLRHVRGLMDGVAQSWRLLSVEDDLLVATGTGLYRIEGDRAIPVILNEGGVSYAPLGLHQSKQDPNRVFVGLSEGLGSVYREGPGRYRDEGPIEGIQGDVFWIVEPEPGELWLGTTNSGAIRIWLDADRQVVGEMEMYGQEQGVRALGGIAEFRGDVILGSVDRILRFDRASSSFERDSLLSQLVGKSIWDAWDVEEDAQGVAYVTFGSESAAVYAAEDGSLQIHRTPFLRFADTPARTIYADTDGTIWFGTDDALLRYDPRVQKSYDADFPAMLRRVSSQTGEIYAGEGGLSAPVRLPHAENSLRFEYSAAVYERPSTTTFQTMLEGFDAAWSEWSTDTRRDYTNIPPGEYTFRIRGRNVYEQDGKEAAFAFAILPPWYRSSWAYVLYGLIFIGLVVGTDRVQRRRLLKKERERSLVEQAELRAAAAEAQSKALEAQSMALEAENRRKQNIEALSRIGRDITSTLSIEQIIDTVYEHVNTMMDAAVFGIGLYNPSTDCLEFPATKERGETLPSYVNRCSDPNRIAAWCFRHQEEVAIQDYREEWPRYMEDFEGAIEGEVTASILYLPLVHNEKRIGVVTAQSFEANAYTENHVNILRNLATYTAIAVDNADAYRRLNATVEDLNDALNDLTKTQEQLVTQEKMASLGALTAGIAHEVKNPLNFVNNFAELVIELADELREELSAHSDRKVGDVLGELDEIVLCLKSNARQIAKHGQRADDIVRGMMQHASGGSGERYEVAVNGLVEEYAQLAFHGMRARPDAIAVHIVKELAPDAGHVSMAPQEIGRVLINLMNNAFDAVRGHAAGQNGQYEPRVTVRTRRENGRVTIEVEDNGPGVPGHVREKIFEPFFTTKPPGSGTGLGLSLSYDIIVHGHGGDLSVDNLEGGGARFAMSLRA